MPYGPPEAAGSIRRYDIDARGYMTIVSIGSTATVCNGGCVTAFSINPAFQADFTAGLIVAF